MNIPGYSAEEGYRLAAMQKLGAVARLTARKENE